MEMITLRRLLIVALCLPAPAVAMTIIERFPVELSPRDREQVIALACQRPHGVEAKSVSGWSYDEKGRVHGADVTCATSTYISGIAMRYSGWCHKERRRWKCYEFGLATYVESTRTRLHFNVKEVDAAVAVAMVEAIVRQRGFNDVDLRLAVEQYCGISKMDEDSWELGCTSARLMVTRDHFPDGTHRFRVFVADYGF